MSKLLKICLWGYVVTVFWVYMKTLLRIDYLISFILTLLLFLLYIWSKHRGKLRRLTKEWILKIVPEIKKGNLEVSGKLVSSVYPAYIQYRKLESKIKKLENEGIMPQARIKFFRQMINDYYQSISAIKDIGSSEGIDIKSSPNIRKIEEKIEKTRRTISLWESKLSSIVESKEECKRRKLAVELGARKIIANWVTGLGRKLGEGIEETIKKEAKERRDAERLASETIDAIKNAIKKTKDQDKLVALRLLQEDVLDLANEFRNNQISYDDFRKYVAERREEAEILSQDNNEAREEKFDNNSQETYYNILEVSPNASQEEIERAYHKKVLKYHPDKFMNQPDWVRNQSEEMTKKINIAYDTLKSPEKRKRYDETIL